MYDYLNKISQFFSEPILQLMNSSMAVPFLGALLLGIIGSLAPCQITGNFTSIAYFGNKAVGKNTPWMEVSLFILGKLGALLLGLSYSVAFCPTMFVIFFVQLMPLVLSTTYGFALTPIFGIGTALPLLITQLFIWSFGAEGFLIKKGIKFGNTVQKCAGVVIILIGFLDIVTYW